MLNDAQKKAVETTEGPLLIIAGAGSGKTKVLTHRILHLIKKGVAPHSILAITFTNKAASEMRGRVYSLLEGDAALNRPISMGERPFVSTFHSLGVHIIRENASLLGLTRNFTIADRGDSKRIVKEALEKLSLDVKNFDPTGIISVISRAKGDGLSPAEFADRAKSYFEETVASVWTIYDEMLAKEKALDFDDLLSKTEMILRTHPDIRKKYGAIWKYVHVDEYQDTNRIQYKIVRMLVEGHNNICVVGDIDQNIYSWRGATIENILNFEKDFPEATVITLEKNYRSTKTILRAANAVIDKNILRRKKNLYTDNDTGDAITLITSYTENEEARVVADEARSLIESGIAASEIAVLYRTNFQSRAIEEFFIKKSIPYQLLGTKFFERKEVKDVLSYIRASLNRDGWGDIARSINVPARGIGKVTLAKLAAGKQSELPDGMQLKIANFYKLLDDIRHELETNKLSESVKFTIQETGIERMLREGSSEDEERLFNTRELVSVAAQYDHLPPTEAVEAFLTHVALATDQDDLNRDTDAVRLMTVHASKGLEFDYVFIVGLEQDLFPLRHADAADLSQAEEEEERRLFYVALTRARKKIYLSHTVIRTIYGTQRVNIQSEFIADIEKELIEEYGHGNRTTDPAISRGVKSIFIDF